MYRLCHERSHSRTPWPLHLKPQLDHPTPSTTLPQAAQAPGRRRAERCEPEALRLGGDFDENRATACATIPPMPCRNKDSHAEKPSPPAPLPMGEGKLLKHAVGRFGRRAVTAPRFPMPRGPRRFFKSFGIGMTFAYVPFL